MKVAIFTLGCRVNIYDTEVMISSLKKEGFEVVSSDEKADVYCINTCTVTNNGDKKSRQFISKAKKKNENAIIAMVGCYPQVSKSEVIGIRDVDIILGNRLKNQLPYYINLFINDGNQIVKVDDNLIRNITFEDVNIENLDEKHRAFIKIQDGCNKFCSYCIIPFARGGVCSKDPRKILEEVGALAKNGYKEIILTGINTTSYGNDLEGSINLIDIIESIELIDGIERIRLGSVDPDFFDIEIVDRMRKLNKLTPHFHLSLQSGCDDTLKRMRRKYNISKYKEVVKELRTLGCDVSITTDVIVGFPGESEEEFNSTLCFLKEIKLSDMHVFKYSNRDGTKANEMENQIDEVVKSKRSKILIELNEKNREEFLCKYVGRTEEVLYCTKLSNNKEMYGYTSNYLKVITKLDESKLGNIVKTFIVEEKEGNLLGNII